MAMLWRLRFTLAVIFAVFAYVLFAAELQWQLVDRLQRDKDLLMAAEAGQVDDVKALLLQGANPNARWRAEEEDVSLPVRILRVLLFRHTPPPEQGATALCSAIRTKHAFEVATLLIQHGANVNAPNGDEGSPLWWAARDGNARTVRLLLDHGARVNELNHVTHASPLVAAVFAQNPQVIQMLIDRGADINTSSDFGSPLVIAKRAGRRDIEKALRRAGATREVPPSAPLAGISPPPASGAGAKP